MENHGQEKGLGGGGGVNIILRDYLRIMKVFQYAEGKGGGGIVNEELSNVHQWRVCFSRRQ